MVKHNIFFICFILIPGILFSQTIESMFPMKWKTEIGVTTFRTNIVFDKESNSIIVGSNGKDRAFLSDEKDGVYILNPQDGKIKAQIHMKGRIDGDVNGLAVSNGMIWFGNDNSDFFCYDISGNKIWSVNMIHLFDEVRGDIEGCPALLNINNDAVPDVVFTIESCGLVALDGKTGSVLWSFLSLSESGYMNSPAVYDLNNDGTKDVVFGAKNDPIAWYGDRVVALNGKDGSLLWEYTLGSAVHASPMVLKRNNSVEILVTECYSVVNFFDLNGNLLKTSSQSVPNGGISGLFSSPVVSDKELMFIGTSWWGEDDGVWVIDISEAGLLREDTYNASYNDEMKSFVQSGRVSSSAFVADILSKPKGKEIGICSEKGELILFDQTGQLLKRLKLPSGVEASAFVRDIDDDGKSELVIACLNGYLYCYETECKENVFWGQFRGNNSNQGVVKLN